jgi:hypothetical protein
MKEDAGFRDSFAVAERKLLDEIERLENAMREIQAATSDVAVVDITDRALCDTK